jgi:hypothetical protein
MTPLAQSFYVQPSNYPNGVFLTSVDLCFKNKSSNNLPVTIQIRPMNSGFPSGSVVLPFSEVSLVPSQVLTTDFPDFNTQYTRFTFKTPVYLTPDEFALMVFSNDIDYDVYVANLGETIIGGTNIVSSQPYTGVFFKSSDGVTFTAYQSEDLMFRLNKAVFPTSITKSAIFVSNSVSANVNMDASYTQAQFVTYGLSSIDWANKATPNSTITLDSDFASMHVNETYHFSDGNGRRVLLQTPSGDNGKYFLRGNLTTLDRNVSPVIDPSRLSLNAIETLINNDSGNETGSFGGNALTRYISRRVTLADGFDANSLQVYLTAYKPIGTNIFVYAKVLSRDDPDNFDVKNWTLLSQLSAANLFSADQNDFREFQYAMSATDDTISYVSNGVTFTSFATFAIKIVLVSDDTTINPILADMRAIALPG